ncbi:hypothetical protein BHYA_0115g00260 [Botrytis hyacinthi]|uniref:C2H2-type domain-containing protein n=1 Tax=Botrytis hyacinthi TaxID=278943 RepID=A0A4Z1GJD9_9HELO|nr:hypothetical protein BHYA_0115g00260 [Botrytis hyacinthi]
MQAARHEIISWEEMALEPIDQHQQTTPPDIGLLPYPDMGFGNRANWTIPPLYNSEPHGAIESFWGTRTTPVSSGYFGTTGSEISFGFLNSAAIIYPNVEFYSFSIPDFPNEGSVENGSPTDMNMNVIELNFFNELPSINYTDVITPNHLTPNYQASILGPAPYSPTFINPDSTSYFPAQVPAQQPVFPSRQQAPQRTTCTRCPRTFSRRTDLPRHMASVHGVGSRAHQCPRPGCGKTYSRSDKVLEHRRKAGH